MRISDWSSDVCSSDLSVWFVSTLDEAGQPSVGSAFVVFSDTEQSFLLASFATVRANTQEPTPGITLRKRDEELPASLTAWDPANDLALLVVDRPDLPALPWASGHDPVPVGDRGFVVSGLGAAGGPTSPGLVARSSPTGLQPDPHLRPPLPGRPA